jgi:hypothetical protein
MTELRKPVRRKTASAYATLYRKSRVIVVSLLPGDVLEFREHGRRGRWVLAVDTAFKYAIRLTAFAAAAEKKRRKAA